MVPQVHAYAGVAVADGCCKQQAAFQRAKRRHSWSSQRWQQLQRQAKQALTWAPPARKAQRSTLAPCPWKVRRAAPSARLHSRSVASPEAVATAWAPRFEQRRWGFGSSPDTAQPASVEQLTELVLQALTQKVMMSRQVQAQLAV